MRNAAQEKILNLLFRALRPLIRLLLEAGIGHREFSEVAKRAYVDVATKNYGIRGRDTNVSRVAVMTGLTRKEVKKIREADTLFDLSEVKQIPANTVLNYWFSDSDFLDNNGNPEPLPFSGNPKSFSELVKRYAGDIPPGALRTELVRTGAVEVGDMGLLKPVSQEFRVHQEDLLVWSLERPMFGITSNIAHNALVARPSGSRSNTWGSRVVEVAGVSQADLGDVRHQAKEMFESATRTINDKLMAYEHLDQSASATRSSVYVGVFYWEDTPSV